MSDTIPADRALGFVTLGLKNTGVDHTHSVLSDMKPEQLAAMVIAATQQRNQLGAALKKIKNSQHGPDCPGYGARLRLFNCTCYVAVARDALALINDGGPDDSVSGG